MSCLIQPGSFLPQLWLRWRSSELTQRSSPMNSLFKLQTSFWFIKKSVTVSENFAVNNPLWALRVSPARNTRFQMALAMQWTKVELPRKSRASVLGFLRGGLCPGSTRAVSRRLSDDTIDTGKELQQVCAGCFWHVHVHKYKTEFCLKNVELRGFTKFVCLGEMDIITHVPYCVTACWVRGWHGVCSSFLQQQVPSD